MPHLRRAALWLSLGLLFCAPSLAAADNALPGYVTLGDGTTKNIMPTIRWDRDSITGAGCWVGTTSTCGTGSSSGGSVTAASGAFATGSIVDIGTASSPAAGTVNAQLAALLSAMTTTSTPVALASFMTGTTDTLLVPAPSGSLHNYITEIHCWNSSATVGTGVDIKDGAAGTVIDSVAAAISFGGHEEPNGGVPFRQPTAATALYVADELTGASVKCAAKYFTGL